MRKRRTGASGAGRLNSMKESSARRGGTLVLGWGWGRTRTRTRADGATGRRGVIPKTAAGLSTDFTDFTDGLGQEASPHRRFHFTRRVKRQPFPTCFKSVESVQSVDPTAFSRVIVGVRVRVPPSGLSTSTSTGEEGFCRPVRGSLFSTQGPTADDVGWGPWGRSGVKGRRIWPSSSWPGRSSGPFDQEFHLELPARTAPSSGSQRAEVSVPARAGGILPPARNPVGRA